MNKSQRTTCAKETLEILEKGAYTAPSGSVVSIAKIQADAEKATRLYRLADFPESRVPKPGRSHFATVFEVTGETTLATAHRLTTEGADVPFCLNFASAKNPGGGFLNGSQAQEESLARSSGLYPCQMKCREFYDFHRNESNCLYSDHMIYSPSVPVIREDEGQLLETPYLVSFLTSPAVNAGAVRNNEPHHVPLLVPTLRVRMGKVLWVAHTNGYQRLILGAWGCGVFQNDPNVVAELFREWLGPDGAFHTAFRKVVFAVYDRTEEQAALDAFRQCFGEAGGE